MNKIIKRTVVIGGVALIVMSSSPQNLNALECTHMGNADIKETNDEITITLSKAYLDKDTVHIAPNTFVRIEDECSHNILSNYEQGRKVQQYWTESAVENSYKYIKEYFNDSCKVEAYTKEQVKELVQTLTNKNVIVNIRG